MSHGSSPALDCQGCCEHCSAEFHYRLIHNGFGDSAYGYCDSCSFTVVLTNWNPVSQRVSYQAQQRITDDLEPLLKRCPCGGAFRACADPRCPKCFRVISATRAAGYIEQNAPGTSTGWRWQQSWSGVYSLVLNDKILLDWWDERAISARAQL